MRTLSALYDSYQDAERAIGDLHVAGIGRDHISLLASNDGRAEIKEGNEAGPGAGVGGAVGAVAGAAAGLLAGLGVVAIPGIGPVVAAGWLVSTAIGAVGGAAVGTASGGLIGAMVGNGVPEEDAHVYAEGIRRGGALVTVRVEEELAVTVQTILNKHRPVDARSRGDDYRQAGWNRFDEDAPPLSAEDLERERRIRLARAL